MSQRFRPCSLDQTYLLPPSVHDWLPEGHLARLLADVVSELDLSAILDGWGHPRASLGFPLTHLPSYNYSQSKVPEPPPLIFFCKNK